MTKKLKQKIKNCLGALVSVIVLAFVLSFIVAPFFPQHTFYIHCVSVGLLVMTGYSLTSKILEAT